MKTSDWLAAALLAVFAVPALAAVPAGEEFKPDFPKFDFTKRPELRTYDARDKAAAGAPLKHAEAKALSNDLFDNYQNISGLALFRFHKRTEDEPAMTLEEIAWADDALAREAKLADELFAEAEAAFKAGIERRPPGLHERRRLGMIVGGAKYARSFRPTLDELRRDESHAIGSIGRALSSILRQDSEPVATGDAEQRAEAEKSLAEARLDLAKVRKEIQGFRQEDAEREGLRSSSVLESKDRVERALKGGFAPRAAPGGQAPAAPPAAGGGSKGKTAEEILREANALPRAAPRPKREKTAVPAP